MSNFRFNTPFHLRTYPGSRQEPLPKACWRRAVVLAFVESDAPGVARDSVKRWTSEPNCAFKQVNRRLSLAGTGRNWQEHATSQLLVCSLYEQELSPHFMVHVQLLCRQCCCHHTTWLKSAEAQPVFIGSAGMRTGSTLTAIQNDRKEFQAKESKANSVEW